MKVVERCGQWLIVREVKVRGAVQKWRREASWRPPDMWRVWREEGQECVGGLVWESVVEERGKRRERREERGVREWKREERERDSEIRERSRWRRWVHLERAARLLMLGRGHD